MKRMITVIAATLLAGLELCISGCATDPTQGYSAASAHPENVRTIAIPIFENDTFLRDIEFELTDAVIKEIEARTPYKVTSRSRADTILLGRIRSVELDQLSKSRLSGLGEEVVVGVTIDFQWKEFSTDRALVARDSFAGHGLFIPSNPTGERVELGRMAVVQQLARDIVAEMRAPW